MSNAVDLNILEKEIRELESSLKARESWLNNNDSKHNYIRQKHMYDTKRLSTLKKMADIIKLNPDVRI